MKITLAAAGIYKHTYIAESVFAFLQWAVIFLLEVIWEALCLTPANIKFIPISTAPPEHLGCPWQALR